MALIELRGVTYTYPLEEKPALHDVNLALEEGRFYSIVGPNGSGKTTLCNVIRGFIPKFFQGELQGQVLFRGKDMQDYSLGDLAPEIGYVFQNPFNQITGAQDNVYEEIAYGLENLGVPVPEMRARVDEVLELTNIAHLAHLNPFELSGGQQQRVALASVIVLRPDVLVIDEPTSQLDPKESERVFDIISRMKGAGKTIILVEHKMDLIAEYSDVVIALHDGTPWRVDEAHEVLSDPALAGNGIMPPRAVSLFEALRRRGWTVDRLPVTEDEAVRLLEERMAEGKGR